MIIRRTIAGITAISGIAVALVTGIVVVGYWQNPAQRDPFITLPPIFIPAILAAIAILTMISRSNNRKWVGVMIGICIGAMLYLIFPALQLTLQYDMIAQDGTGFWAVIMLPSIYFGIPLPILGALLGFIIGFIVDRVMRKSKGEQTPSEVPAEAAGP